MTLAYNEFECGGVHQLLWPWTDLPGGHMRTHAPILELEYILIMHVLEIV